MGSFSRIKSRVNEDQKKYEFRDSLGFERYFSTCNEKRIAYDCVNALDFNVYTKWS